MRELVKRLRQVLTEDTATTRRNDMLYALGYTTGEREEFWEAATMLAQAGLGATDLQHIAEVEARLGSYTHRPGARTSSLEAEARALFRVAHPTLEGNGLPVTDLPLWLAVARKARELHSN